VGALWEPYSTSAHVTRAEIKVKVINSLLAQGNGLEVSGLIEGAGGVMRGVIGLGPEPEAQKFCEQVLLAVEQVNPRPAGKWPTWMGGR
jgi:hypothetical protein